MKRERKVGGEKERGRGIERRESEVGRWRERREKEGSR